MHFVNFSVSRNKSKHWKESLMGTFKTIVSLYTELSASKMEQMVVASWDKSANVTVKQPFSHFFLMYLHSKSKVTQNIFKIHGYTEGFWQILKTSKKGYEVIFFVCIFWRCVQYTTHWDKTQMSKKNYLDKINGQNKCSLFSFASSNSSQFTFCLRFLHELKHKVHLSKTVCGIFHCRFRFIFIKVYIFIQQCAWTVWF